MQPLGPRVLLIGDTILNRTYRARPSSLLINRAVPFSYMNEEYLELVDDGPTVGTGEISVQGVGYIARYLAQGDSRRQITVWTGLGMTPEWDRLRSLFDGYCDDRSDFSLGNGRGHTVIRVLREVRSSARAIGHDDYRPQLRIESPPAGPAVRLDDLVDKADLAGTTLALIRASSPEFFTHPWSGERLLTESDLRNVADRTGAIQRRLQHEGVPVVMDLRPIPPSLRIVSANTVLCTTIGRLRDYWALWGDAPAPVARPEEIIIRALWKLSPLRAIVCYIGELTTVVCQRGSDLGEARIHRIEASWPPNAHSDIGVIAGGDAYVAGLLDGLLNGPTDEFSRAARRAHAALVEAVARPIGHPVDPAVASAAADLLGEVGHHNVQNDHLAPLQHVLERIRQADKDLMTVPGLISPEGGGLANALSRLTHTLEAWSPSKGKDLIAVFGESRSGKEYAVRKVLDGLGFEFVGPVNMHQFLRETGDIVATLTRASSAAQASSRSRRVLIIDEIQPGHSARPLLNLMAEKSYMSYARGESLTFEEHPVILMSSIEEDLLLDDLRGRLACHITIPPLRERLEDLPYLLPLSLADAPGVGTIESLKVDVSYRFLDALLSYDFLPRPGALDDGLNQRNFRALTDLVHVAVRSADSGGRLASESLTLLANDLPASVAALASHGSPDDQYVTYPRNYRIGTYPSA